MTKYLKVTEKLIEMWALLKNQYMKIIPESDTQGDKVVDITEKLKDDKIPDSNTAIGKVVDIAEKKTKDEKLPESVWQLIELWTLQKNKKM